jgi:hypothetical protein
VRPDLKIRYDIFPLKNRKEEILFPTPIKHIYRKNQCIFMSVWAKRLILLIPNFFDAEQVKKIWFGKYEHN